MSSKGALAVGIVLAVVAVTAMAGWGADGHNFGIGGQPDPAQHWKQMLERFDRDHDGKISKDEYQGPAEAFGRLDANGDGFLTREEMAGGPGQGGWRQALTNADRDGDGKVSREEWPGGEEGFRRFDKNGDGFIDQNEMPRFEQPGGGQPGGFGDVDPAQRWQRMRQFLDANQDGQIGRDEFRGPEKLFDLLDRNGDGVITEDEAKAAGPPDGGPGARFRGGDQPGGDAGAAFRNMLKQWDQNGDGRISKDEWQGREEMFARLDADGDGFVTEAEMGRAPGEGAERRHPLQQLLGLVDKDADGQVSAEEWQAFFKQADANGNGFVTIDELTKVMRPPMGEMGPPAGRPNAGGGPGQAAGAAQ